MTIDIDKIQEVLPEVLNKQNAYFVHSLMSRITDIPFHIRVMEVKELFVSDLCQELMLGFNSKEIFAVKPMHNHDQTDEMHLFLLDDEVLVFVSYDFLNLTVYAGYKTSDTCELPKAMFTLSKFLEPYSESKLSKNGKVNLLCMLHGELTTKEFKLEKSEVQLSLYYNDGMDQFHKEVVLALNGKRKNGIIFLHGKPGTGKTTYLRYLISHLNRKVIFVPSDMVVQLGSPDFMQFMLQNKKSVIIIEDAESVLEDRSKTRNGIVSNLLNLSDGILSDALNIQFICTFNTDINHVDEAFFRGGRMIAMHEFQALDIEKANYLAKVSGMSLEFNAPTTLAEIFHDLGTMKRNAKMNEIGFIKNE